MNTYYAGQSVRFTGTGTLLGAPNTPSSLVFFVIGPKPGPGQTPVRLTASIVDDVTGAWHADLVIPSNAPPGLWWYGFQATGSDPSSESISDPVYFVVQAPAA